MDFSEPLFNDSKFREIMAKLSELEKHHLEYVSVQITDPDLSKIEIPAYVRQLAIDFCESETTVINMILRSFTVEQLEGDKVNHRRLFTTLKEYCKENKLDFDKLSKYIMNNF